MSWLMRQRDGSSFSCPVRHPNKGEAEIKADATQAHSSIIMQTFLRGIPALCVYFTFFVINQYLSTAITTIFKIEAVQQKTSDVIQKSQTYGPKVHMDTISLYKLIGKTMMATKRSAVAKDTIKLLVNVLISRKSATLSITKTFPMITDTINKASKMATNISTGVIIGVFRDMVVRVTFVTGNVTLYVDVTSLTLPTKLRLVISV